MENSGCVSSNGGQRRDPCVPCCPFPVASASFAPVTPHSVHCNFQPLSHPHSKGWPGGPHTRVGSGGEGGGGNCDVAQYGLVLNSFWPFSSIHFFVHFFSRPKSSFSQGARTSHFLGPPEGKCTWPRGTDDRCRCIRRARGTSSTLTRHTLRAKERLTEQRTLLVRDFGGRYRPAIRSMRVLQESRGSQSVRSTDCRFRHRGALMRTRATLHGIIEESTLWTVRWPSASAPVGSSRGADGEATRPSPSHINPVPMTTMPQPNCSRP